MFFNHVKKGEENVGLLDSRRLALGRFCDRNSFEPNLVADERSYLKIIALNSCYAGLALRRWYVTLAAEILAGH